METMSNEQIIETAMMMKQKMKKVLLKSILRTDSMTSNDLRINHTYTHRNV